MNVKQFRYGLDNFGYLIYHLNSAVAVDGGAVDAILVFARENDLTVTHALNTHSHQDHTMGTRELLSRSGAEHIAIDALIRAGRLDLAGQQVLIYHTPGHTADSITFHAGDTLVTGDTLFNATVGNCFSGDLRGFYDSIKKLLSFSDETVVYAGHDYVRDSIAFAKSVEPDNRDVDAFMASYDPDHVWSTLDQERKINPFLRFNEPTIISHLEKLGLPVDTEYHRWESVMTLD